MDLNPKHHPECNSQKPSYFGYWGKYHDHGVHLLVYHLLDVAGVGYVLLGREPKLRCWLAEKLETDIDHLVSFLVFLLALHDLGKFSPHFQGLQPEACEILGRPLLAKQSTAKHHTFLGYQLWIKQLGRWLQDQGIWESGITSWITWRPLMLAVFGHHGLPPAADQAARHGSTNTRSLGSYFPAEEQDAVKALVKDLVILFKPKFPLGHGDGNDAGIRDVSFLLAGLTVLCDWIGSNNQYFPPCSDNEDLATYWQSRALPQAEQAVSQSGVVIPPPGQLSGFAELFPDIPQPSPLQQYVDCMGINTEPQLLIIEDMTGSGKTEAALTAAHRLMAQGVAQGLFMALPTMATSNAMYDRLASAYDRLFQQGSNPSLILAHGARHLSQRFRESLSIAGETISSTDEGIAQCSAWLADNRKKALLAAVGVGTIDQIFLGVLPSRHQSLRLLGLARQVLIVDEVHAYDPYMHELLCTVLRFQAMMGGSAVLLSATLPMNTRRELVRAFNDGLHEGAPDLQSSHYPLVTYVNREGFVEQPVPHRSGTERRVTVEILHDEEQMAEELVKAARDGGCVCWVRNTVFDVLRARDMLCRHYPVEKILVFHARFAMYDRLRIEKEILRRFDKNSKEPDRAGYIVLASQVIEQSLDVDFDLLASDLAPMELLIQRFGRCQRHARPRPAGLDGLRCLVLTPPLEENPDQAWFRSFLPKAAGVYPFHGKLWLAARLLKKRGTISLPEQARELIEHVYDPESDIPATLMEHDDLAKGDQLAATSAAWRNALDISLGYEDDRPGWSDDTRTPTRLGEDRITLRLARWENGALQPWATEGELVWNMSEINMPVYKAVCVGSPSDPLPEQMLQKAMESMPDKGRNAQLFPLQQDSEGVWNGVLEDKKGQITNWCYDPHLGLYEV